MPPSFELVKRRLVRTGRSLHGDGRGWTLAVVAAGWLSILGGRYLFPAVLPQVRQAFRVSNATAGAAITTLWAAYALMQFPAGALVDSLGERALLTTSLVVAAAAVGAVSLVPTFPLFVVGCVLFGLGTGIYGPARGVAISKVFGKRDGTAIGLTLAAGSIGSAAFPFLASVLVGPLGWQTTVALLAIPFLFVAVGIRWTVPRLPAAGDDQNRSVGEWATGVKTAVSRRAVVVAVLAATLMLFVMQGLTAFLPTYLIVAKDLGQEQAAGLFALFFLSGALAQFVAGGAADRYGDGVVLLTTTAAFGVIPLLALPLVEGLPALAVLTVLLGFRLAVNPVSNAYIIAVLPKAVQGTAWGLLRTGFFLLAALGSTVVGGFFDAGLADESFFALAGLTTVAAGLYVFLPSRETA